MSSSSHEAQLFLQDCTDKATFFAFFDMFFKKSMVLPRTHYKTVALLSVSVPLDICLKARFCKFAKKTICHKK